MFSFFDFDENRLAFAVFFKLKSESGSPSLGYHVVFSLHCNLRSGVFAMDINSDTELMRCLRMYGVQGNPEPRPFARASIAAVRKLCVGNAPPAPTAASAPLQAASAPAAPPPAPAPPAPPPSSPVLPFAVSGPVPPAPALPASRQGALSLALKAAGVGPRPRPSVPSISSSSSSFSSSSSSSASKQSAVLVYLPAPRGQPPLRLEFPESALVRDVIAGALKAASAAAAPSGAAPTGSGSRGEKAVWEAPPLGALFDPIASHTLLRYYQLQHHDSQGEPETDLPALDPSHTLSKYVLSARGSRSSSRGAGGGVLRAYELCLTLAPGVKVEAALSAAAAAARTSAGATAAGGSQGGGSSRGAPTSLRASASAAASGDVGASSASAQQQQQSQPLPPPEPAPLLARILLPSHLQSASLSPNALASSGGAAALPYLPGTRVGEVIEELGRRFSLPVFFEAFALRLVPNPPPLGAPGSAFYAAPLPTQDLGNNTFLSSLPPPLTLELFKRVYSDAGTRIGGASAGATSSSTSSSTTGGSTLGGFSRAQQQQQQRHGRDGGESAGGLASPRRGRRSSSRTGLDVLEGLLELPQASSGGSSAAAPAGAAQGGGGALLKNARFPLPSSTGGPQLITAEALAAASAYREWRVVKTNAAGRKQQRMLGVDLSRMFNKLRPGASSGLSGLLSGGSAGVVTGERPISSVRRIEAEADNPLDFFVTVAVGGGGGEGGGEWQQQQAAAERGEAATGSGEDKCIRIPFQAECEKDREDILEKFRLVLSTTGDASRVKA